SNEDAGVATEPALEQARYGRLTDIQHVLSVTVDQDGRALDIQYEGLDHRQVHFLGKFDGTHPIIYTETQNNTVTDRGSGPLRFAMTPQYAVPHNMPVAELMRENPQWFEIEEKELARENKITSGGPGDLPHTDWLGQTQQWLAM